MLIVNPQLQSGINKQRTNDMWSRKLSSASCVSMRQLADIMCSNHSLFCDTVKGPLANSSVTAG
jgi:hypothetical protein